MSESAALAAARAYERRQAAARFPGERPRFHAAPLVGWANDPNGFCWYQGEYHLFYQYYPYRTCWGPMHWGHAVSGDLLRWTHRPAALAPDTPADADGCFSGSAVGLPDGRMLLLYTGMRRGCGAQRQTQCIALGDGEDFEKYGGNPVIDASALPEGCSAADFRDPKIWRGPDGNYFCVAVSRHKTAGGSALLFCSRDAFRWQYRCTLDASRGAYGKMWECPDFFALDGVQLLVVSMQEMQATPDGEFGEGYGTLALLGEYDPQAGRFARRAAQPVDYGPDFYAPQTLQSPDGRRILIAWMENWATCGQAPRRGPWFGRMTLPRELSVRQGRLFQQPVRELENLRQAGIRRRGVTLCGRSGFEALRGRTFDLSVVLDVAGSPECRRFALRFAEGGRFFAELRYIPGCGELTFDRSGSTFAGDPLCIRRIAAPPAAGRLSLRVIMDGDSVEVFVNEGERTLTAQVCAPPQADGISFVSDGPAVMDLEYYLLG